MGQKYGSSGVRPKDDVELERKQTWRKKLLPDFLRIRARRKRPYRERLGIITKLLNENRSVSVWELVRKWGMTPDYCKKLLRWAAKSLPYASFDEESETLEFIEVKAEVKEEATIG